MTARIAIVAVVVLLTLTGCSAISSGTITEKEHEPYALRMCSVKPLIFCPDDEDWRFDIRDGDEDGWVYVTEETFDNYEVGDYWQEIE